MQLPDHSGFIASLLKHLGEGELTEIELGPDGVVYKPVLMAVFPGKYGSTRRAADRVGHHATVEPHPLPGDPVDIGSWGDCGQRSPVGTDGLVGVVVTHNIEDIRPLHRLLLP